MLRLKRFIAFSVPLLICAHFLEGEVPWIESSYARKKKESIWRELIIERCHDGDTCKAYDAQGLKMTLRLIGVDAPEVGKPGSKKLIVRQGQTYGQESRSFVNTVVKEKKVLVEIHGADVYRRYLATVYPTQNKNEKSLNQRLVEEGYAFAYRGKMNEKDLQKKFLTYETQARKEKKGMWALSVPPTDPALYRKSLK